MRRLLLACGVAVAALAAPWTASGSVVALQDDRLPNLSGAALTERLDLLASTGARVTRVDVLWSRVATRRPADATNPDDPAYDWATYDQIMRGLTQRGIGVILDFYSTPAWASASGAPNAAPRAAEAGAFAGAIARRYSGTWPTPAGTLPEVRRIEVWNEPNIEQFWSPQCRRGPRGRYVPVAARGYAALVDVAAREIRRANPDAIVVGGVAGPAGSTTDRGKTCRTGTESVSAGAIVNALRANDIRIDAWSQHLYPIGAPDRAFFFPSWRSLDDLTPLLDKLRPGMPVYVTETGYHTSYNRFHRYFVSESQQARWLTQTFDIAARNPRVAVTVWFNLQDNPSWTGGLLHADLTRKPAWDAFSQVARTSTVPQEWLP